MRDVGAYSPRLPHTQTAHIALTPSAHCAACAPACAGSAAVPAPHTSANVLRFSLRK